MKSKLIITFIIFILALQGCSSDQKESANGKRPCGGTANFSCPNTMFCELKENCGGYDTEGFCSPRPQSCSGEIKPICGCDNQTYSNKCLANAAGITLKSPGGCKE